MKTVTSALRTGWRATWNGPFHVGRLSPPIALGDALLKVLETLWRTALVFALAFAAVLAAAVASDWVASNRVGEPKLSELRLTMTAFDPKMCEPEYPLFIGVVNNSKRTLKRTYLTVEARRRDRSTNLVSYSGGSLDDDAIIKPGEGWGSCWRLPELTGLDPSESPKSLVWSVRATAAEWADN